MLARLLDEDLVQLGDIAHRLRGKCTETILELRPQVTRMQQHHAEVVRMLQDARQASELKRQLAVFSQHVAGKTDQIANDLGATYLACGERCAGDGTCRDRYQLERAIADMPTY